MATPRLRPIGLSCSFFGIPAHEDLKAIRDAGFEAIEVCAVNHWMQDPPHTIIPQWSRLAAQAAALGLTIWSFHLPYVAPYDISRTEPAMAGTAIRLHEGLMHAAAQTLMPRKFIIHASHEPICDAQRSERMQTAIASLDALSQTALSLGAQLALECLPRSCLGKNSGEIAELSHDIPGLGICCDTNHLLTERAEHFILRFPGRIASIHLSDYDGVDERHWLPGKGINNWPAILQALDTVAYHGPLMLEVRGGQAGAPITVDGAMAAIRGILKQSDEA